MTTPLIMLATMMAPYLIAGSAAYAGSRAIDLRGAGATGLGLLFVFTGIGHFAMTEPMAQMLPPWVPARIPLIYLSGFLEFAIAIGFFVPKTRRLAGWAAAAVLVLFFPANIYAAIERVPMGGHAWGPVYLLVRAPLHAVIVAWVYWFTIREPDQGGGAAGSGRHPRLPGTKARRAA